MNFFLYNTIFLRPAQAPLRREYKKLQEILKKACFFSASLVK